MEGTELPSTYVLNLLLTMEHGVCLMPLHSSFIVSFTGQCLLLCVARETSDWSTSIGFDTYTGRPYIHSDAWTTKLSYVCQYHSKPLYGLRLSVYQSLASQWIDRVNFQTGKLGFLYLPNCNFCLCLLNGRLNHLVSEIRT